MPHGVMVNTMVFGAVVPGSSPGGATEHASVAQLDQSTSLRTRRPQVRVLPGVPNDGLIAQSGRAFALQAKGPEFESPWVHKDAAIV